MQTTMVRGRVTNFVSGAALGGVHVKVNDDSATTDADGRFILSIAQTTVMLEANHPGFQSYRREVNGSERLSLDIALVPQVRFFEHTEVRAAANPLERSPSLTPIRPSEVQSVAGGAENVFRVLTTLPGVSGTDELSSRLSVRGGGPDQNLTVMDGVEIHDPYRLFGLVSAFNPETVESFELTTGAFSAKYGDRLSSILTIDNRNGSSRSSITGSSALSLTDTNAILEGGLPGDAGSWILTGRRTYYDLVAERFTDSDLPSFGDVQGKISFNLGNKKRLTLFGLLSREGTDAALTSGSHQGEIYTHTRNDLYSIAFDRALGNRGSWRTLASYYDTENVRDIDGRFQGGGRRRSNTPDIEQDMPFADFAWESSTRTRDLAIRQDISYALSKSHLLEVGFESHHLDTRLAYEITGRRNAIAENGSSIQGGAGLADELESERQDRRYGAWLIDRMNLGRRVETEAGLRLSHSTINGDTLLEPRFRASWKLAPKTHLQFAAGWHAQSPGYEKLVSADYLFDLSGSERLPIASERSTHVLMSLERELASGLTARIEGYYKRFDDLIVGRLETPAETLERVAVYDYPPELAAYVHDTPIITSQPSNDSEGRAYGFDVFIARRATSAKTRFTGWASYTYGIADCTAYGRTYPFDYDRRHTLSLVGQWRPSQRLELALTGRFASGFPTTPPVGLSVSATADENDLDGDGDRGESIPERDNAGRLVYVPDFGGVEDMNTARQPNYLRIDSRLTWTPRFGKERLSMYLDVINVLNRTNPGIIDYKLEHDPDSDRPRLVEARDGSIPILPSIGIHYRF
ncbi:MAG: TonB-dependent receptor [Vicinamibacteria bacterium]|nr:TonB-dependent receptor [Vicinamibacteria bacterium]